jgi:hypothetical protein
MEISTIQNFSRIQQNELIHMPTWTDLQNMLKERRQTQISSHCRYGSISAIAALGSLRQEGHEFKPA